MAIETDIRNALVARVSTFVASPALPVAWENLAFTPPASLHYLRAVFVPNIANRVLIDSDGPHQRIGLLQVSVHWKIGEGHGAPLAVAAAVAAHFPCDTKLRSGAAVVRITKAPDVRDMLVEDAGVQIPVIIPWEAWI